MNNNFFLPTQKPTLFSLPPHFSTDALLRKLDCSRIDTYALWQKELFEIRYPKGSQQELNDFLASRDSPHHGKWAYYPWRNQAIHIPDEHEFREILFSRNYPIIEKPVQNKLWELQIGSAGLSVGSNIAIELVKTGVQKFKLADYDTLAPSNNNRITGGNVFQIGENKTLILAKKLYELNPYCKIEQFPEGLTVDNFKQFVQGCDILIDEIDSFPIKNLLRDYIHSEAGKHTILLQGADLGETPIVEIEKHNDPKFGGRLHEADIQALLQGNPSKLEATRMLVTIVGRENIPSSFLQNFINIKRGEQTYWAQLGIAATAVGAKIASMVIEIARGSAAQLNRLTRLHLREVTDPEEKHIHSLFDRTFCYLPPSKRTIFSSDELALQIQRESGKTNRLHFIVGSIKFEIKEIPGNEITKGELDIIHKARQSYKMWGDDLSFLLNDPTDKQWETGMYETTHLIASIKGPNNFHKTFALKKTYYSYQQLLLLAQENHLPLELAVWRLNNAQTSEERRLWDVLHDWIKNKNHRGTIATVTRFCTIAERKHQSAIEREATAITFAAMQLFNSLTLPPEFVLNIITKPSLQKIFSIRYTKGHTTPVFYLPEKLLNMDHAWKTYADISDPLYTFFASKVPGYFALNPLIHITPADEWRQSAIALLQAAKKKYR